MWHVTPQHAIHFWHVTLYICHLSILMTCVYSHIIVSGAELGSYGQGGGTDPTEGQLLCEGGVHLSVFISLSLSASPVRSRHLEEVVCVTKPAKVSVPWDWTVTTLSPGQFSPPTPSINLNEKERRESRRDPLLEWCTFHSHWVRAKFHLMLTPQSPMFNLKLKPVLRELKQCCSKGSNPRTRSHQFLSLYTPSPPPTSCGPSLHFRQSTPPSTSRARGKKDFTLPTCEIQSENF